MLYCPLFQAMLVLRWLSLRGLAAAPLFFIGCLSLPWTEDPNATPANIFAPMTLREMVLAVWLIVKGFEAAALASGSAMAEVA